jgi:hypothetical protein
VPYVTGYAKVRVWVPPGAPGGPPDWGIEEFPPGVGIPGFPDQGLPEVPPGIGGGPVLPGWPERPGQPLPPVGRPPRPVYPVVDDPDDLGGHPELPDLNMSHRVQLTDGTDQFTGYVLDPEPPQVEEGYEPRYPERGLPGTWVAVLYGASLAWAWVRTPGVPGAPDQGGPGFPEREPKRA